MPFEHFASLIPAIDLFSEFLFFFSILFPDQFIVIKDVFTQS